MEMMYPIRVKLCCLEASWEVALPPSHLLINYRGHRPERGIEA